MSGPRHVVVIGNGMAGARFVEQLVARGGHRHRITVFGEEPHGNYNRILLSSVLAGSHDPNDIVINPLSWYAANGVTLHAGARVDAIDARRKRVTATRPRSFLRTAVELMPKNPLMVSLSNHERQRSSFDCGSGRAMMDYVNCN